MKATLADHRRTVVRAEVGAGQRSTPHDPLAASLAAIASELTFSVRGVVPGLVDDGRAALARQRARLVRARARPQAAPKLPMQQGRANLIPGLSPPDSRAIFVARKGVLGRRPRLLHCRKRGGQAPCPHAPPTHYHASVPLAVLGCSARSGAVWQVTQSRSGAVGRAFFFWLELRPSHCRGGQSAHAWHPRCWKTRAGKSSEGPPQIWPASASECSGHHTCHGGVHC